MEIKKETVVECVINNEKNIYHDINLRYNTSNDLLTISDSDGNSVDFIVTAGMLEGLEEAINACYSEAWNKENN